MADLIGQQLGQYVITAKLGSGGMATVYRARQGSVGRDVAVKVIEARLADNPEFVKRFEREAHTIASLNHSHILKLFDYGQHGDQLYLVMELLQGGSLADRIHNGPLDVERTGRILDQMASALDYAHGKGIVHRDLKPQNVLFDEAGDAHLTDFGIAKVLNETSALTGSGTAMGTPAYMSPEQCQGRAIDARSDIYALGIMLYEMLAGELPFKGDTPVSMIYMHLQEPPPAIRALRPDLPASVEQVIFKALAKDPAARFQTAGSLAAAFKMALTGQTAPGIPVTRSAPPARQLAELTSPVLAGETLLPARRRRSGPVILGALALIVILAVIVVITATNPPAPTPTPMSPTAVIILPTGTALPRPTATASMLHTPELNATRHALETITALAMTPTASPTNTPNLETRVAETFAARSTQTASAATKTPTANDEETLAAIVGATDTAVAAASFTKTPTPTNTLTPSWTFTPTDTPTATLTPSLTLTPTSTPITTVTANNQWTPTIRLFENVPMVMVPPGCFTMGSASGGYADERPTARICFDKPFWIDQYEVTNFQFMTFGGQAAQSSNWIGSDRPRESITWIEARDFCAKRGARLPTEAEWEYAARGPDDLIYPWGNTFVAGNVVFAGSSGQQTADVGSRSGDVSWVGVQDMSGNVEEWVSSLYRPYPFQVDDGRESEGALGARVLRGGSFGLSDIARLTTTARDQGPYGFRDYSWGFRCARAMETTGTASVPATAVPGLGSVAAVTANNQWLPVVKTIDNVEMMLVPPGCFTMGSASGGYADERPTARICFDKPFWIDKYEVSNFQFMTFGGQAARPSNWIGSDRPRESITWIEARDFCAKRGARLPTEAEWEYAARGPDDLIYPWGNTFVADNVVFVVNSNGQTANVGSRSGDISWVGALDMSGNVAEWVSSLYRPYPFQVDDGRESEGALGARVLRGGSFGLLDTLRLSTTARDQGPYGFRDYSWGFRCARSY